MKISKFLWSVLVVFATVALIAPQQVEAIIIDGRIKGQIELTGSGTITGTINESTGINSNGISSNGINELDFNGQNFPHGPLSVTNATGDFIPFVGSQANFNLAIRWTGSGSSVTLLDVLPGVGGPAWHVPIVGANGFATGTFFSLKSVTFDEDSLTLIGMGTTQTDKRRSISSEELRCQDSNSGNWPRFHVQQPYCCHDCSYSRGRVRTWPPRDWLSWLRWKACAEKSRPGKIGTHRQTRS